MLFFKRIFAASAEPAPPREKRRSNRYVLNPAFPLQAVLSLTGRDNFGNPLRAADNKGWDWKGHLVDFSSSGARMHLPAAALAARGDDCHLKLSLDGYQLVIPSRIAHLREQRDHVVFGLALNLSEAQTRQAYRQLLELVVLGASLKPAKSPKPDDSGYLVEQYGGSADALLKVWRESARQAIAAFELKVKEYYIRGTARNRKLQYFAGGTGNTLQPIATAKGAEMRRLFQWVVPNISTSVPADVLAFLKLHA